MEFLGFGLRGIIAGSPAATAQAFAMTGGGIGVLVGGALGVVGGAAAAGAAAAGIAVAIRDSNALDPEKRVAAAPTDKWFVAQEEGGFGPEHVVIYAYETEQEARDAASAHTNYRRIVYGPGLEERDWRGFNVFSDEAIRQGVNGSFS